MSVLLLDQVAPSVSIFLELINTCWAEIRETCRVHLIAVAVAPIDKPLLPCDLEIGKGGYILGLVFPWPWTIWCLSWVIPSDIQSHQLQKIDIFFAYWRNYSNEIGQSSSSLWPSELASHHLLVLPIQILGFLPSNSKTTGFYTIIHIKLEKVPSWCLVDNYCCIKTRHMEGSYPNSCHTSERKLSTCLLVSDWCSSFDCWSMDDMLS
jgi:hypothetical protein